MMIPYIFIIRGNILLKTISYILCFLFFASTAWVQETTPELEIEEEYQIIGRDTRVFTINGDRISTVGYTPVPLELPDEERSIESSEGIIGDSGRLHRGGQFAVTRGLSAHLDYEFGTNTTNNLFAKAWIDSDRIAATVRIMNRSAEEHTPTNMAPLSQELEVTGYYDASTVDLAMDFGISREDDDALNKNFRPGSRETDRYRAGISIRPFISDTWDIMNRLSVKGGTYRNFGVSDEENEWVINNNFSATRNISGMTLITHLSADYVKLSDTGGSSFATGAQGKWLFMNSLGIDAGANIYAYTLPDEDTEVRIYPNVALDWAVTSSSFVRLNYKPGITTHSFDDIYSSNGLATLTTPFLFEDRSVDFDGSIGIRFSSGFNVSGGGFFMKTRCPPVFSRAGDFFDIVQDAEIELAGYRVLSEYTSSRWGINGDITINRASWNFSGDVPYIPNIEALIDGYWIFFRFWKLRTSLHYYGKHYIETNSDDTEDVFLTIDLGVDRELWKQYISMYLDLRNILNSKGSWWTEPYEIPGAGLYLGIRAHY